FRFYALQRERVERVVGADAVELDRAAFGRVGIDVIEMGEARLVFEVAVQRDPAGRFGLRRDGGEKDGDGGQGKSHGHLDGWRPVTLESVPGRDNGPAGPVPAHFRLSSQAWNAGQRHTNPASAS